MKAMILAAGLGTRLRPLTNTIPKPMIPVAGVPNIERIITHLRDQGISEFVINLHHAPSPLRDSLGNGARLNVNITYSPESHILGTGGGIKKMLPLMGKDAFVVVNGDTFFMPPLKPLVDAHHHSNAMVTMVVRRSGSKKNAGNVGVDEHGRVKRLLWAGDNSITDLCMFTGMHIINPQIASSLPDTGCIVRQAYIPMMENGLPVNAAFDQSCFKDLGTPSNYLGVNLAIARGDISLPGFTPFADRNIIAHSAMLGEGTRVENSVIGENVTSGSGLSIQRSVVMPGATVTQNIVEKIVLLDGTMMDADLSQETQ